MYLLQRVAQQQNIKEIELRGQQTQANTCAYEKCAASQKNK